MTDYFVKVNDIDCSVAVTVIRGKDKTTLQLSSSEFRDFARVIMRTCQEVGA